MRTVAIFFGAFISRSVGAEGTGLYTIVMTVYSFAITFATSGVSLSVTRLVASLIGEGKREKLPSILSGAVAYSLLFSGLAFLFCFFGANFLGEHILSDIRTSASVRVLSFSLIPIALSSVLSGYFIGTKQVFYSTGAQVISEFIRIGATVALLISFSGEGIERSVLGLALGITAGECCCAVLLLLFFVLERFIHKDPHLKNEYRPNIYPVAKMAIPLALSACVRSALLNLEHILIPRKLMESGRTSSEAYSDYGTLHGMALPLILYPMSPLSSFSGLLVPEFAEDSGRGDTVRMARAASAALSATLAYAAAASVFLYVFSEELGYIVYNSYGAGFYIALLAFVVPIMYLDHVTDQVLKGIGEHIYSMWVNISDSVLSVLLVILLIPRMGIIGYAVVIIIMEGYNFILSFFRLRKKIRFKVDIVSSLLLPFIAATVSAMISERAFFFGGSSVSPFWLFMKLLFAVSLFVASLASLGLLRSCFLSSRERKILKTNKDSHIKA